MEIIYLFVGIFIGTVLDRRKISVKKEIAQEKINKGVEKLNKIKGIFSELNKPMILFNC